MSYLVFARKYRPQDFDEIIGQEESISILKNSIKRRMIHHAFLFSGPRGVGKTSCARILAKALNCVKGPTISPCNKCPNCLEITEGRSLDVVEIDGASNRGIDEIRNLREAVKFAPVNSRFKVYIIDEVHQISHDAFNALLKTLEEPPSHVKFIFATTQPEKVPSTILSRCQKFNFHPVRVDKIIEKLKFIVEREKLSVKEDILHLVAQASRGSIRDAESILDQIAALSLSQDITFQDLLPILGIIETENLHSLAESLATSNPLQALEAVKRVIDSGVSLDAFLDSLIDYFRNLLVVKISSGTEKLVDLPPDVIQEIKRKANLFEIARLLDIIESLIDTRQRSRILGDTRLPLELCFIRLTLPQGPFKNSAPQVKNSPPQDFLKINFSLQENASKVKASSVIDSRLEKIDEKIEQIINNHKENSSQNPAPSHSKILTLEDVARIWEKFHNILNKEKKFLHTYLEGSTVKEVKDNVVVVELATAHNFHKEHLEEKKNRSFLENVLAKLLHSRVHLNFKIGEHKKSQSSQEPGQDKAPSLPKEKIENVLKIFNGEVVDRDGSIS